MLYVAGQLAGFALLLVHLLFWPLLCYSLLQAQWWRLQDRGNARVWLAALLLALCIWQIRGGIAPGLEFHLLGTTLLTLMFGRHFAILGLGLTLFAGRLFGAGSWEGLPASLLVAGMLPAHLAWLNWRLTSRLLAANLFVYLFVAGFFNAAVCMIAASLANALLLLLAGAYDWNYLTEFYLPYALLLGFPEAFCTGAILTLLVIQHPQWLLTFEQSRHLQR